jgi:hypothetical protein
VRLRFGAGSGRGPYGSFQQTENAMRAERINTFLDQGTRVFGDDGQYGPGKEYEIEEAVEPLHYGIRVKTKCGSLVTIYAYDASDAKQKTT